MKVGRAVDLLLVFACGGAAYALSVHAGRIGYMPLDQSIVFDGAWRVLNGQVPWRDFMTPNGLVPIVLQAGIFAVTGVNWSAYAAQAAVVNAVGAMVVFGFLRESRLGFLPSTAGSTFALLRGHCRAGLLASSGGRPAALVDRRRHRSRARASVEADTGFECTTMSLASA